MSKRPLDMAVTPNGLVAVVRGHAPGSDVTDGLTFVSTTTGFALPKSSCDSNAGEGGYFYGPFPYDYQPSDSLQVTNSRAILIGSRDTDTNGLQDMTFIDVLAIDVAATQPVITCLAHHEEGSTTVPGQIAGWTNDVALTPDESLAIVNSSNWIHVIDLATGAISQSFNIGTPPWNGPGFAGDSVDSVAATNDTAIVTTTRYGLISGQNSFTRTWVYLLDLSGANPPYEHELTGSLPTTEKDFWPHDVVITPNGQYGIVTANNAVAVYDLAQRTFLARHMLTTGTYDGRRRFFSDIVDSVEATDEWFVTIATDQFLNSMPASCGLGTQIESNYWIADVFELPPNSSPDMTPRRTFRLRDDPLVGTSTCGPTYAGLEMISDKPHDLAIDDSEALAVIRTANFNLVLTGLDEPDPQDISMVKLLDRKGVLNNNPLTNSFVSDSVLIPPGFVKHLPEGQPGQGVFHYALTLGAEWKTVGTFPNQYGAPWVARVDVLDLTVSPPAVALTFEIKDTSEFPHIYPADLHAGPGPREFTLRCNAQPYDSGVVGGRDFIRFDLDPLGEVARIGAEGRVWAVDSLEVGRFNATSVGDDTSSSTGFVHVVRVQ